MKKIGLVLSFLLTAAAARAELLFSDALNYPNGSIETNGLWYCFNPPANSDAIVTNGLLILNTANHDAVAAPTNGIVNPDFPSTVYASFTINVSQLPAGVNGGYFCEFLDVTNNSAAHVFIDTKDTVVPGTYRLGIANFATSIATAGATNFPMDLATGITYQVVVSWDETASALGATFWINPSSESDQYVYPSDITGSTYLQTMPVATIGFSPYGGVQAIGTVMIGTQFSDVMTNVAQKPVIGIQPQGSSNYLGDNTTLYTAASGMDVTYQWYSNDVALVNDGVTVVGANSQVLNLSNLQATATYYVVATTLAGDTQSSNAVVGVNTTPTRPFFTILPQDQTNSLGSTITLTAEADGTGPISYEWYFEPTNGGGFSPAGSGPTLSLPNVDFGAAGSYYVQAIGGVDSSNSPIVTVTIVPPPLVSIGYLHSLLISNAPSGQLNLNNSTIYEIHGVVTSIGEILSKTYSEYFVQDDTGGAVAFVNGTGNTNTPPAGAMVSIIGPAQQYYGALELAPNVTTKSNQINIVSYDNPLPAPRLLNLGLMATNTMGDYGLAIQGSLVTLTNVYLYSSKSGAAVTGTFPVNSTKALYAFLRPYASDTNQPYMEVYVYTYTNAVNQLNTNYFGKPIPSFCYQLTGAMGIYNPTTPEVYPTRYEDFVTTQPASLSATLGITNGSPTITWPAATGSTYSVYSATNLLGPWTQVFGLSYFPSVGAYTDTNAAPVEFYRISTP